jgi:hypothetical protein
MRNVSQAIRVRVNPEWYAFLKFINTLAFCRLHTHATKNLLIAHNLTLISLLFYLHLYNRPLQLNIPGSGQSGVHTLRTIADSTAIVEDSNHTSRKKAVIIGGSFIGMEVFIFSLPLYTKGKKNKFLFVKHNTILFYYSLT